jgi:hypothetical protein
MPYTPDAGAVVPAFALPADWAAAGTITVAYPTGFTQGSFTAGVAGPNGSYIIKNNNDKVNEDLSAATGIGFSFGASLVTLTNNTGATIVAGTLISVFMNQQDGNTAETLAFPIELASVTAADIVAAFRPGLDGYIENVEFVVNKPVTTGSKLASLNPKINSTAVTGGVVALTSALATPMGARIAGSQVTALNRITKKDSLSVTAASVTAFIEGSGTLLVRIRRDIV